MTANNSLSKVDILIKQKKFTAAETMLKDMLAMDSGDVHLQSLLAEVHLQQDKFDTARSIIDNAIGRSPDAPHLFYIRSRIAIQEDNLREAENDIRQAVALDPYDADYFALLANILLARKQYQEALETAGAALSIDAENLLALNTRSTALIKLNKPEESFATIEGALREDPNNAYTHANYGWSLLEQGNHKKALEHFKESLQNDPGSEYAQSGMLEALKAGNPVYRIFLKYAFWISNLTARYQWGVIIGFYLGFRGLRVLAQRNEALQPYLTPLIVALALIAFSTWIINPISNLFLRFNKYGQLLLSRKEKMSSNFVAISFLVFIIGALCYFIMSDERFLSVALFGFAMMLPFSAMFAPSKKKNALPVYAVLMAITGIIAIIKTFAGASLLNPTAVMFLIGFIGFQWIANYMLIKEGNQ